MLNGMNENPKPRAAVSGSLLAAQYSQLVGTQQLGAGGLASLGRSAMNAGGLASLGRSAMNAGGLASLGRSAMKDPGLLASLGRSAMKDPGLLASLGRSAMNAGGLAGTLGSATGWMAHKPAPIWTHHLAPISAAETFTSLWRGQDVANVLYPLLETAEFRPFGGAAAALADWAEERLAGIETASSERFAEIAGTLAEVELDEESERRVEHLVGDEAAFRAVATYWGLEKLSLTKRETILAISILAGFSSFVLLVVGMMAAPALTAIITGSIGGGAAAGKTVHGLLVKYSPETQAKLDAMKPSDPNADDDDGPET